MREPIFEDADKINELINSLDLGRGPATEMYEKKVLAMVWLVRFGESIEVLGNASNTD